MACLNPTLPWYHLKTAHKSAKFQTLNPFCLLFPWRVKGVSSPRIVLKVDVLEGRKTHCLQARPCIFAANVKGWDSEGVKHYVYFLLLPVMSAPHVRTLAPHHHHLRFVQFYNCGSWIPNTPFRSVKHPMRMCAWFQPIHLLWLISTVLNSVVFWPHITCHLYDYGNQTSFPYFYGNQTNSQQNYTWSLVDCVVNCNNYMIYKR